MGRVHKSQGCLRSPSQGLRRSGLRPGLDVITLGARGPKRVFRVLDPKGVFRRGVLVPQGEIVTASVRGAQAHVERWLGDRRVEAVAPTGKPISGVCRKCGCTWADACPGGCAWVDGKRTLCSSCALEGLG